jgi:phosphoribosylamine-glycine ligase
MHVLVVGSGGREHAIVHALQKSKKVTKIFVTPGIVQLIQEMEEQSMERL